MVRPRVAGVSLWHRRPHRPGQLHLFLPAGALGDARPGGLDLEDQLLQLWSRQAAGRSADAAPGLRFHYLPSAADGGPVSDELLCRACLQTLEPEGYAAYVRRRNRELRLPAGAAPAGALPPWVQAAAIAGVELEPLVSCVRRERGAELVRASMSLADSLELDRGQASALIENRILVRRIQPEEAVGLWEQHRAR
jgi:hypothetical protein